MKNDGCNLAQSYEISRATFLNKIQFSSFEEIDSNSSNLSLTLSKNIFSPSAYVYILN